MLSRFCLYVFWKVFIMANIVLLKVLDKLCNLLNYELLNLTPVLKIQTLLELQ